jgi:hypothetical protein
MRGTFTPYSLPAFTGAFDLTPLFFGMGIRHSGQEKSESRFWEAKREPIFVVLPGFAKR